MQTHLSTLCWVPAPRVPQAVDDKLIIQRPDGASGIDVNVSWPSMSVEQRATLQIFAQNTDGSARALMVANCESVTEEEVAAGWRRLVKWEQLQQLEDQSALVVVFKIEQNDGDVTCPVHFPPLFLEVQDSYEFDDETTFKQDDPADDWNGWMRGEAGTDPRDLVIRTRGDSYVLHNNTHTHQSAGSVLSKAFVDLKVGQEYEFGIEVCKWNAVTPSPNLALMADIQQVVPATEISSQDWVELKGTFKAEKSTMHLSIVSQVATGYGNDYAFRKFRVKSV